MTVLDTSVVPSDGTSTTVEPVKTAKPVIGWRRFTKASLIALVVAAVPYLWVLWDYWDARPHPLRAAFYTTDFYDVQARAILNGHLWVSKGSLGIEAFIHDGKQYEFFGLFPALLRLPLIAFVHSVFGRPLFGRLTAPFLLLAWLLTWMFVSLLIWRVRVLVRGSASLGRAESFSLGVLVATVLSGSVLVYLASTPYVYNEDFAWSVALTTGCLFALLGVLERPSRWRVAILGLLLLCNALNRVTTGYACILAVVAVAIWLALGRRGPENRRWWLPVLAVGLIPLVAATAVNFLKFGTLFGVSEYQQVWTSLNPHRRYFLARNGGTFYGLQFLPTTLEAYFQPAGLRFSWAFPFISFPASPPAWLGGAVFDKTYRTGSVLDTMPLLVMLSIWGTVAAFRRRAAGQLALVRIPLMAAFLAGLPVMVTGYIALATWRLTAVPHAGRRRGMRGSVASLCRTLPETPDRHHDRHHRARCLQHHCQLHCVRRSPGLVEHRRTVPRAAVLDVPRGRGQGHRAPDGRCPRIGPPAMGSGQRGL